MDDPINDKGREEFIFFRIVMFIHVGMEARTCQHSQAGIILMLWCEEGASTSGVRRESDLGTH